MSDIAIKVEHLTKVYHLYNSPRDRFKEALHPLRKKFHHDFYAVNDVSFEIKRGETIGIIGQNGSGKSTLLKMITGVLTPTSGTIEVNGRISSLLELGTGFNPDMTGLENIYFYGTINGMTHEQMSARVDDIVSFADIGEFIHQPVKTYSSGMFVRLAFSAAVHIEPDILIVDEALSVGDAKFQAKSFRKMDAFRQAGKTLLFVSHSTADVVRLSQRGIWINEGSIKRDGLAKHVVEEYIGWTVHGTAKPVFVEDQSVVDSVLDEYSLVPIPPNAEANGEGGARIDAIGLYGEDEKITKLLTKSQIVKVVFRIRAMKEVHEPWIGFSIINAKGIRIVGANNCGLSKALTPIQANSDIIVSFIFALPEIENGKYFISVMINDGVLRRETRLHNIIEAYDFEFTSMHPMQKQLTLIKLIDAEMNMQIAESRDF